MKINALVRNILVAAVLAGAFVACGGGGGTSPVASPSTGPTSLPTVQNVVPPANHIYFGSFSNPTQVTPPPVLALHAFETTIGRTVAITPHYYGFYDVFPQTIAAGFTSANGYEQNDLVYNRMPVESWDCEVPNAAIAAGNQDALIKARADTLKAYGKPIMLRYMWEMNLPSNQFFRHICYDASTDNKNGAFSPTQYIAAWIHMRHIFLTEGATNVIWLWNPSGSNNPLAYYPGDSQVDWVGFDKYDDASIPFLSTYSQAYGWLSPLGKPILVGETGAAAAIQPSFFASAASTLSTNFPLIKGFVYFNSAGPTNSWVIDTTSNPPSAGLTAFKAMAADPYFSATPPP